MGVCVDAAPDNIQPHINSALKRGDFSKLEIHNRFSGLPELANAKPLKRLCQQVACPITPLKRCVNGNAALAPVWILNAREALRLQRFIAAF